eukprot:TRINITY_DN2887_c0_g2_i1.p1 TRINITY_DN2887_c0_g2~~TRINITY_DN2887_c0_g2_i1.p1  ORF type:complete len:542 (+),score=144.91 TRINITY_DN2887_c0_g2_i1:76-1626(+)
MVGVDVEVDQFLKRNAVDARAGATLREEAPEVQAAVLDRGDLQDCLNPSAALLGRIRAAKDAVAAERRKAAGVMEGESGGSAGSRAGKGKEAPVTAKELELFVRENKIDEVAAKALMEAGPGAQRSVLSRGGLTDCRNPSAVCLARLREAKIMQAMKPRDEPKPLHLPAVIDKEKTAKEIEAFLERNVVDGRAGAALRAESAAVQRAILDRGDLHDCANQSAALMGRLNSAKEQVAQRMALGNGGFGFPMGNVGMVDSNEGESRSHGAARHPEQREPRTAAEQLSQVFMGCSPFDGMPIVDLGSEMEMMEKFMMMRQAYMQQYGAMAAYQKQMADVAAAGSPGDGANTGTGKQAGTGEQAAAKGGSADLKGAANQVPSVAAPTAGATGGAGTAGAASRQQMPMQQMQMQQMQMQQAQMMGQMPQFQMMPMQPMTCMPMPMQQLPAPGPMGMQPMMMQTACGAGGGCTGVPGTVPGPPLAMPMQMPLDPSLAGQMAGCPMPGAMLVAAARATRPGPY